MGIGPIVPQRLSKKSEKREKKSEKREKKKLEKTHTDGNESVIDLKSDAKESQAESRKAKNEFSIPQKRIPSLKNTVRGSKLKNPVSSNPGMKSNKEDVLMKPDSLENTSKTSESTQNPKTKSTQSKEPLKVTVFPATLSVFEPLNPSQFYSRHYYLFRYIINPSIYSASVCIFYSIPWIPLVIITIGICFDILQAARKRLFKKDIDNTAIMVENCLFLLVSIFFAIFFVLGENSGDQTIMGWLCIIVVVLALTSVVFFKFKGREVL